jgi:hypothetical protein
MILSTFRCCALGALLAGTVAPSLSAASRTPAVELNTQGSQRADSGRSRRVELPFPLEIRTPGREPPARVPRPEAGPHPFREFLLKRASLAAGARDSRRSVAPDGFQLS